MNINRHNYETFFLLYVDKELSAAEAKAVEVFVDANPDLKAELQMLQHVVIAPEAINIDFKHALLKEESITALQEKLLLLVDDELNAVDKKALQLELQKNAIAATELNILQQTKLSAETDIVFADKKSLYKKEPAKVVGIRWWRIAAAAVLFGFGTWGAMSIYNKQNAKPTDANQIATTKIDKVEKLTQPVKEISTVINSDSNVTAEQKAALQNQNIATINVVKKNAVSADQSNHATQKQPSVNDKTKIEKDNIATLTPAKKETNNLPTPLENINIQERNKNNPSFVTPIQSKDPQKDIALVPSAIQDKLKSEALAGQTNPIAKNAVYNEGDNNAVAMQDQQEKHSKFGGFLRKVKRIVERTTKIKTGDDDVIKVAGFDIAIK